MHRTIVVAASHGGPLEDALALGVGLARPRGARVLLTHVDLGAPSPDPELEQVRASAPQDVPVDVRVVGSTSVVSGLRQVVEEASADALVLGATHLGAVRRTVRGDVALDAIREVPCAIASAPAGYAASAPHAPRRIGVAWDGSSESDEALEWAVQLAERTAGEVRILHVGDLPGDGVRLERLRQAAADRAPATVERLDGEPGAALAKVEDVDLLVLGSRGRSPARRVVGGSVSAHVVHRAGCPVVVLPRGVPAPVETTA